MSDSHSDSGLDSVSPAPDDYRGNSKVSSASQQILAAQAGDLEALSPVIESISPYLLALAKSRLGSFGGVDAEDLVQEAWSIGMRRLPDLVARDGHLSPVLFRFLSSTITRKVNDHLRLAVRQLNGNAAEHAVKIELQADPASPHSQILKRAIRTEMCKNILDHLDSLPNQDRELFLRRALEGLSYPLIGQLLNEAPNTLAKRYQRLRQELSHEFDSALLDEFMD
ncbi:MAG: RNA polymerase sigma factor (sigma-70 family) [Planctomycetota bacterium]|jgi:RNA polymerase sigma factor (sigma-70 family)